MGIFSKTEIVEVRLPFVIQKLEFDEADDDSELGGLIDFEAYERVGEDLEKKYFYALVACNHIPYEEFSETLLKHSGISLKVAVKLKAGKPKSFKIDFKDLALQLNDERYGKLFMADDSLNDTSSLTKLR